MGLTIQYNIKSTARSHARARLIVEQMRQLALDLPFEEVGEVVELDNPDMDTCEEKHRWLVIQAVQYVSLSKHISQGVNPTKVFAVSVWPGKGCEEINLGLCLYPKEIEENGLIIKTKLSGFQWRSFCKTQYASNPECGGIPNFLRCHVSCITLLDRIAELPMLDVEIDDEGKYGPSNYSDDWKEAGKADREPTYVWHNGKYNVKTLAEEVGSWNQMIAAAAGALKDATDGNMKSPITSYPNFEQLEFQGSRDKLIEPFLFAMKKLSS